MTTFSGSAHAPVRVETITDGHAIRILIHGEADVANVDLLDAALRAVPLDGATSVFVDASGLAFFDVAVLRCLTDFAQVVKRTGRDIATCASPMLHDVARMLELQDELGLH